VLFADGELVGPDLSRSFEAMTARVNAERDLDNILLTTWNGSPEQKDNAWSQITLIANGSVPGSPKTDEEVLYRNVQRDVAKELLLARDSRGESTVYEMVTKGASFPGVWRKQ
jgi:hypothetical protein